MNGVLVLQCSLRPGETMFQEARSPRGGWVFVFEDDGETGYAYAAREAAGGGVTILDAVHIYNAEQVADRDKPSRLEIWWTEDGQAAALVINGHAHAVVDFKGRRMCCRTGFPPANGSFTASHDWDEGLFSSFRNSHHGE